MNTGYRNWAFLILIVALGCVPRCTFAASVSVTVAAQADGRVVATARGGFTTCMVCDAWDAQGNCTSRHPVSYGGVGLERNGGVRLCTAAGEGGASCTSIEDRGILHGTREYRAVASDCTRVNASSSVLSTLDNTPSVTLTAPSGTVSGPYDITGTATFKPTLSATKGTIYVSVNGVLSSYHKTCLTETCAFSYKALAGQLDEMRHGGPYPVTLMASGGGASASDQKTFSVDNRPTVTVTAPSGIVSGPYDITGTATFKPTLAATKGTIYVSVNGVLSSYHKTCLTETCAFSYKALAGQLDEMRHGGPYPVTLVASGGGASASAQTTFSVDNTPSVVITAPEQVVTSPFNIIGRATFKPTLAATKGTIHASVNGVSVGYTKVCTSETCTFSYQELTGQLYALRPGGPYTVTLVASTWGVSASATQTFQVANCRDNDGDSFFGMDPVLCPPPLGKDCDDTDPAIYPGAPERCNDKDNNCNGVKAEGACDALCVPFASSLNPATGALVQSHELFSARGASLPTRLSLHYNSVDAPRSALGIGWMHNYELALTPMPDDSVIFRQGDGKRRVYQPVTGGYRSQAGDYSTLAKVSTGWRLIEKSGLIQDFDRGGRILAITDRNSNRLTFQYTGVELTTVSDAAGRTTTFTYTPAHVLSMVTDPYGNRHAFSYQGNRLTSVTTTDTQGGTRQWTYAYDATARMLSKADPNGQTTRYAYDASSRVIASTTPDGQVQRVLYDTATAITRLTASDGGVWVYRYDPRLGVMTQTVDPLGNVTRNLYDTRKQLVAHVAPDGGVTRVTYDGQGNVTSITDALGQRMTFTATPSGQVTSRTGARGDRTVYAYDAAGNLLTRTDPRGGLTRYAYDAQGYLLRYTDTLGQGTALTYDVRRNLASITDPTGVTLRFTADVAGNVTRQTDAQGNSTAFVYDSLNQLLQHTDPLGNATAYTYDATGNRLSQTDPLGNHTTYAYNVRGQLVAVEDALHNVTTYDYSPSGCPSCGGGRGNPLTRVTDAKAQATTYRYDRAGRLLTETTPLGRATTYTYDAMGRPRTRTDANGATIAYAYDALGRLRTKTWPDGTTTSFTYDVSGNILTAANPHMAYTLSYDLANQLTAVTDSRGLTVRYAYDVLGRRTQMTYPDGSAVSYTYDAAGRLTVLTHAGRTVTYRYDSVGRRAGTTAPNKTVATYTYDKASRLTTLTHSTATATVLERVAYAYDRAGNRTVKDDRLNSYTYKYDALSRLVAARNPPPALPLETFTYDAVGNRLYATQNGSALFDADNQLLANAHFTYQYDANGNLTRKTAKADGALTTYAYDAENRLSQVVLPTGATVSATYDAFGRRITQTVRYGATLVTQYVYDGLDILAELDDTQALIARYIYGPGMDEPQLVDQEGHVYVYHADGLGSITTLTDAAAGVAQRYTYAAFGMPAASGDPRAEQPYTFTGREWDAATGLYHYRARAYDAATGRFLQRDPIGFAGGDLNVYRYVRGNPINWRDPMGLDTVVAVGGPTPINPFGHVAIAITGQGVYSFGTGTPFGSSFTDYLTKQAEYRDTTIMRIHTTPTQEARILNVLKNFALRPDLPDPRKEPFKAAVDTCATRTNFALAAGNIVGDPMQDLLNPFPGSTAFIAASNAIEAYNVPMGNTVPFVLFEFNPR